jgi:hypothetical protein
MTIKNVIFYYTCLSIVVFSLGCATSTNAVEDRYVGIYESSKNNLDRFIIDFDEGLYRIQYNAPEAEWEGVGYERGGKIVAVLRHSEDEEDAEFLNISFPGNDQVFVVARNLEGGYLRDGYFTKVN